MISSAIWILKMIFLVILHLAGDALIGASNSKPNFVLMLADDLGIGDIGCYGNTTIRTPNIDKLANDGVKLTQHIAAARLCTPSRAAFMTGRYALRSGMDSCGGAPVIDWLASPGGLPPNETTFASILQKQGYTTGIIGKWHLGMNCESLNDHCHHPLNHGFDYFYGMPLTLLNECQPGGLLQIEVPFRAQLTLLTQIMAFAVMTLVIARYSNMVAINWKIIFYSALVVILFFITWYIKYGFIQYWSCIIMRNHEIIEQPMNLERTASQMLREVQHFIDRSKDTPFLLIVSFLHVHTPLITTKAFTGKSKHGLYGDNVEEMDFMVGSVVNAIDNAGLKNSTMIYFTSDHGGHLEAKYGTLQTGGWNGIYRGGAIWKAHYVTPVFSPDGAVGCYDIIVCACEGDHVHHHDPPLLFELLADPSESKPLDSHVDPQYKSVLSRIKTAVTEHQKTISVVPQQLSYFNSLWRPWLQPCCGTFPFCWCDKEDHNVTGLLG
ncbi:arylsulfatase D-like isoform X4 [Eleutherodactylus coqui]|uniref:arylsulfatase D-like isoform X4 n=1 Tax=Eleutherodactylus coqui TaxID=57060 RepID=UPI003461D552